MSGNAQEPLYTNNFVAPSSVVANLATPRSRAPELSASEIADIARLGFEVLDVTLQHFSGSQLVTLRHNQTGATVLCIQRPEDPMLHLNLRYRTIPGDSSGVFHKLEHCLLGGGAFIELMRGLILEDLNALTGIDHTQFIARGTHEDSVLKAMRTIVDLTLAGPPSAEIFAREHGRVVPDSTSSKGLSFEGVVHSEMRAAMSNREAWHYFAVNGEIFAGSPYELNSGGDPRSMAELSYEDFVAAYHSHYCASRAVLGLSGGMPLVDKLTAISDTLSRYESGPAMVELPQVPTWPTSETVSVKAIPGSEDSGISLDNQWSFSSCFRIPHTADPQRRFEREVLAAALCGADGAPLKDLLREAGTPMDFEGFKIMPAGMTTVWAAEFTRGPQEAINTCQRALAKAISDLAQNGIDPNFINAYLNDRIQDRNLAMQKKHYGGALLDEALNALVAGADPVDQESAEEQAAQLQARLERGEPVFQDLIKELLLNNPQQKMLVFRPSATFLEEVRADEQRSIDRVIDRMSEPERVRATMDATVQDHLPGTVDVSRFPRATLTPEMLRANRFDVSERRLHDVPLALCREPVGRQTMIDFRFDITDLSLEDVSYAEFLAAVIASRGPTSQTLSEFSQKTLESSATYSAQVEPEFVRGQPNGVPDSFRLSFVFNMDGPIHTFENRCAVLGQILNNPELNDRSFMQEICGNLQQGTFHALSSSAALLDAVKYRNIVATNPGARSVLGMLPEQGLKTLEQVSASLAADDGFLHAKLDSLLRQIVRRERLAVEVLADSAVAESLIPSVEGIIGGIPTLPSMARQESVESVPQEGGRRVGISAPLATSVVLATYALQDELDTPQWPNSAALVTASLLERYLYREIREKGKAYGWSANFDWNVGQIRMYSIEDPNPQASISAMRRATSFLRHEINDDLIERAKVAALAPALKYLDPFGRGGTALGRRRGGISAEQLDAQRQGVVAVTAHDIAQVADLLDEAVARGREIIRWYGPIEAVQAGLEAGVIDAVEHSLPQEGESLS
jgi:Zn-dependent M16 (insulinase) family peptidase